ncbi:hypothetical protein HPP92_023617 [Vanilla planifolia]|uniref:Uncharacterized protein n=1 Tax=Vanilla planifolia TaxID=51239 RepID=A0A835PTP8_VANPL|nr:hypothetical protein HPP92_023617 [Vanilla planifolia]
MGDDRRAAVTSKQNESPPSLISYKDECPNAVIDLAAVNDGIARDDCIKNAT